MQNVPKSYLTMSRRRAARAGSVQDYHAYINSDAWRLAPARLAEILDSGGRCRICNAGGAHAAISVHHRTYERLGCEALGDLTALCGPCHDAVTDMLRERAYARKPMPAAGDVHAVSPRMLIDRVNGGDIA